MNVTSTNTANADDPGPAHPYWQIWRVGVSVVVEDADEFAEVNRLVSLRSPRRHPASIPRLAALTF
jgi:hypothetical protein